MRFVTQIFISEKMFFSCNVLNVNWLDCVSMNNQERKVRPELINVDSDKPSFHSCGAKIRKCRGTYNKHKFKSI